LHFESKNCNFLHLNYKKLLQAVAWIGAWKLWNFRSKITQYCQPLSTALLTNPASQSFCLLKFQAFVTDGTTAVLKSSMTASYQCIYVHTHTHTHTSVLLLIEIAFSCSGICCQRAWPSWRWNRTWRKRN
jgi:hypothetical protein